MNIYNRFIRRGICISSYELVTFLCDFFFLSKYHDLDRNYFDPDIHVPF